MRYYNIFYRATQDDREVRGCLYLRAASMFNAKELAIETYKDELQDFFIESMELAHSVAA